MPPRPAPRSFPRTDLESQFHVALAMRRSRFPRSALDRAYRNSILLGGSHASRIVVDRHDSRSFTVCTPLRGRETLGSKGVPRM